MEPYMNSLRVLREEHRLIERMLGVLDDVARSVERGADPPRFSEDLLDFFQLFADETHHAKEEHRLFPELAKRGMGPHGVVEAMVHQHDLGRTHIRDMRRALARVRHGDDAARGDFAASAAAYGELLRVHIQIEDDDVYPMAERVLDEDGDRSLTAEFARLDSDLDARAQRARWDGLLEACRSMRTA
jgi:hemerythrin-like domain-containing protein